ncbi:carbohydrate ABC transporter permease [Janthinobacterium tructae]|uniref:Sugar ABC transporter permease n=1 Tax=Janthinobacterium tructae TaxID=2590869 RepID=A0A4Y6RC49_9BURK|nr:sugar ABC transporter permease [Janthinobacterium tructae]QDG70146.1 sugar ABC transporter permease [Janthinobacterium tructae]
MNSIPISMPQHVASAAPGKIRQSALTKQRVRSAWIFLTPMLIILALVAVEPLGRSIWLSLTNASLDRLSGADVKFVGLENYFGDYGLFFTRGNLIDPAWAGAIKNTLFFALCSVTLETVFGTVVALVLNVQFKGRGLVRTAVLVPWAIPTIVSAKMWDWMLQQQYGVINSVLAFMHFDKIAFTTDFPMFAVLLVDIWKTTPFMSLLILAALQMLPKDCYEAAQVDGIHPVRVFFKVTLPLIKPALMVAIIFRLLDALRVFDVIYVLTGTNESTISMSGFVRESMIANGYVGQGSAASTVLFLIIALCTLIYMKFSRSNAND